MKKIEEILKTLDWKIPLTDKELEVAFEVGMFDKDKVIMAMKQFGKICFEAGRENKTKYNPTKDGKLYQISIIPEYSIYEDFLKEIEDETEN